VSAWLQYIKNSSVKVCIPSRRELLRRGGGEGGQGVHEDDDDEADYTSDRQSYQSSGSILRRP
jgi:hypothetical protein